MMTMKRQQLKWVRYVRSMARYECVQVLSFRMHPIKIYYSFFCICLLVFHLYLYFSRRIFFLLLLLHVFCVQSNIAIAGVGRAIGSLLSFSRSFLLLQHFDVRMFVSSAFLWCSKEWIKREKKNKLQLNCIILSIIFPAICRTLFYITFFFCFFGQLFFL